MRADLPEDPAVVLVVTTQDDASLDPLALDGLGWAFGSRFFPRSDVARPEGGTTAPRAVGPDGSATCASCAQRCADGASGCQPRAHLSADDDALGVRFWRMRYRFGVDPRYPVERYGALGSSLVTFAVLGGAPQDLVAALGGNDTQRDPGFCAAVDPEASGAAPSRPESHVDPRMQVTPLPRGDRAGRARGVDRDWDSGGRALQHACTFPLETPRDCRSAPCACADERGDLASPLCEPGPDGASRVQRHGGAVPGARLLAVALRRPPPLPVVGSVCASAREADPLARRLAEAPMRACIDPGEATGCRLVVALPTDTAAPSCAALGLERTTLAEHTASTPHGTGCLDDVRGGLATCVVPERTALVSGAPAWWRAPSASCAGGVRRVLSPELTALRPSRLILVCPDDVARVEGGAR